MRQQHHRIGLVIAAQRIDQLLQLVVANAKRPVRREALGVGDRHIGKRLPDHRDAVSADFLDGRGLEHPARRCVERLGVVEGGLLSEKNVLREEFALEALEVGAQRLFAVSEFPVAGHRLDAEQIGGLDHVRALHRVGEAAALPQIAAVEQHRVAGADVAAQAIDQRLEMREAAKPAETGGGFFEIETGEGIGVGAVEADAEAIEKGAADQMRRAALHRADAEIDAGLAEIHRQQLRMGIGHVQDARIAEAFEIVNAGAIGSAADARQSAGERGGTRESKEIAAADRHVVSPPDIK